MNWSAAFLDFLSFEQRVFGNTFPIASYDPALIRYGEYRFVLEHMQLKPGCRVLDLGCEANIFILYLASKGLRLQGIDIDPAVWRGLHDKKRQVEKTLGHMLDVSFKVEDATRLTLEPSSFDAVIAISSIEHMFGADGHGDQMAVGSIARVLRPGGFAFITVPMSNGAPFHESRKGDARFAGPYRLYTAAMLPKRLLSNEQLDPVSVHYLVNSTPDPRYEPMLFHRFWLQTLSAQERGKWAWAFPMLSMIFNPIVDREEGEANQARLNTALICLQRN